MDLRQLQALVAIADHGSFSAAANALQTVQSNVSSHVARLERELGVQLVDRHAGELTPEGRAVVARARRVSAELEAAVADVAALHNEIVGTVRLGMIGTTARWLAPLLLDRMADQHPKVQLVIGEGTSATLNPQLLNGALDAAVVNLPQGNSELVERPLFDEDLVLIVPAHHDLAGRAHVDLGDLDGLPLLLPAPGTTLRQELDDACRAAGVTLSAKAELDGLRLIASLSVRGYGAAIIPATGAAEELTWCHRLPVAGLPRRRVGVVARRRARPSAPARATIAALRDVVGAGLSEHYGLHAPATADAGAPDGQADLAG
jgi:LysR family hydrogen peroxide-inducible transcriptional activator